MPYFLGIDLGTSSIKGALLDTEAQRVSHFRRRPFPDAISATDASHLEVSPSEIVEETRLLIAELLTDCESCAGVLFSSQMGGIILARPDGKLLTNYISWRDQRGLASHPSQAGSLFEQLKQRTSPREASELGNELAPGSAASILFALAETGQLPDGELHAANLGDYVVAKLCEAQPRMELTMAVGIVNLRTGNIHDDWLAKLTAQKIVWPQLVAVGQPAGEMRTPAGKLPCFAAVGDHQAALLGAGVCPDELSINISTGSQVGMITPSAELSENYQTRPFFNGQYVNTITHLPAGRALNALVDLLTDLPRRDGYVPTDPWQHIIRAIDEADDAELAADIAFFDCKVGTHGSLNKMRLESMTVGHVFRAAVDNMVDNYLTAARRLAPDQGWNAVVLSGGLAQKINYLRDTIQQRLAAPLRIAQEQEETLSGLLCLARQIGS
ncbi:MAG: FGGY family carbohydrate kinase [Planctomycetota bacterium]